MSKKILDFLPILVIAFGMFFLNAYMGDYEHHLNYRGEGEYPPMLAWIMNFMENFISREISIFLLLLVFGILLPFLLITKITKSWEAGWVYLYGSQIPLIFMFIWILPQAIVMNMMLLIVINPFLFFVLFPLGFFTHNFAWIALIIAAIYKVGFHDRFVLPAKN